MSKPTTEEMLRQLEAPCPCHDFPNMDCSTEQEKKCLENHEAIKYLIERADDVQRALAGMRMAISYIGSQRYGDAKAILRESLAPFKEKP